MVFSLYPTEKYSTFYAYILNSIRYVLWPQKLFVFHLTFRKMCLWLKIHGILCNFNFIINVFQTNSILLNLLIISFQLMYIKHICWRILIFFDIGICLVISCVCLNLLISPYFIFYLFQPQMELFFLFIFYNRISIMYL